MPNTQPIERQVDNGEMVEFINCWKTIQGEGPYAGWPALFIRLAGCNLQCPGCDTQYSKGRRLLPANTFAASAVEKLWFVRNEGCVDEAHELSKLVVITGGEPFRQQALVPLCRELVQTQDCSVQIETNGTLWVPKEDEADFTDLLQLDWPALTIVVSPKTPKIHSAIEQWASAYKYVIHADHVNAEDGLPIRALESNCGVARPPREKPNSVCAIGKEIYVQPYDCPDADDEENRRHIKATVHSALTYGYRLSLQMHKLLGLD